MPSTYLMIKGRCVQFQSLALLILFLYRMSKPWKKLFSIYLHKSQLHKSDLLSNIYYYFTSAQTDEGHHSHVWLCLILCSAPHENERRSFGVSSNSISNISQTPQMSDEKFQKHWKIPPLCLLRLGGGPKFSFCKILILLCIRSPCKISKS